MRNPEFIALLDEIKELHDRKSHDYAGDDPLSNLRMCAKLGVEPWRGVLVRMSDKWSRIEQLTGAGKSPLNESLRDSIKDLAIYGLLCLVLMDEAPRADAVSTGAGSSARPASAGTPTPSHIRAQSERTITVNRSHHG